MLVWDRWCSKSNNTAVSVSLVSIGLPAKAKELREHLQLQTVPLYVDPTNAVYDALDLRRGVGRTFFNPATPFAFLDRIREGRLGDLGTIMKDWKVYIPPEQEQAFLQGGTFVFDENDGSTVYAHYDPSTAAHAPMDTVLKMAGLPVDD